MGVPEIAKPVCLICAITYNPKLTIQQIKQMLLENFGPISHELSPFPFTFTDYYAEEMGTNLKKLFYGFQKLIAPEDIVKIKHSTNRLELEHSQDSCRNINLDPGYLEAAKLVLATTKNFDHRIYLGDGIYGDIHLRFRQGAFRPLDWTYPDYQENATLNFLVTVRKWYITQLASLEDKKNDG